MRSTNPAYWRRGQQRRQIRKLLGRLSIVPTAMLAMMLGALAVLGLQELDVGAWLTTAPAETAARGEEAITRIFAACGFVRVTCVVDGDTFWLDGTKIRIADINTPEVSSPQCAQEAALGRRATERLTQLLNAGPFTLARIDRDEDRYGRKLRIVRRDGQSVGMALVAEGLAEAWQGYRGSWC